MKHINPQRRAALRMTSVFGMALAAGLLDIQTANAEEWNKNAFEAKNLNDVIKSLGGVTAAASKDVVINAPDIAENGAVVPVAVVSSLPNVQQIAILVEKNPNTLAANFSFPTGTEPGISTRIKMNQTSNVHALVKADGKWLLATKEIKVTLGGCGG